MSNSTKTVIAVIAILVIAGGGYYWYTHMPVSGSSIGTSSATGNTASNTAAALPGGSSDSDAALNSDAAAIDTQMSGLNADNANLNTSMNDQPITQN